MTALAIAPLVPERPDLPERNPWEVMRAASSIDLSGLESRRQ